MIHYTDFKPYSNGRMQRILSIYEAAFTWRKQTKANRGETYSDKWKKAIAKEKKKHGWNNDELLMFLDYINHKTMKEIRGYLLDNGSSIVRVGRKTRRRKKK